MGNLGGDANVWHISFHLPYTQHERSDKKGALHFYLGY